MPAIRQANMKPTSSDRARQRDVESHVECRCSRDVKRRVRGVAGSLYRIVFSRFPFRHVVNRTSLWRHRGKSGRKLEIGPAPERIEGFETLNIRAGRHVDYIIDACGRLPFADDCFELVYASHVLEHVPWYQTEEVLREWVRILRPGGMLEIWVPDGLKVCRTLIEYEDTGRDQSGQDGWYRFNDRKDVCRWAAGRIFSYGDGTGRADSPNWHRALFSPRYIEGVMERAGLVDVCRMDRSEVRGSDHGWINLGVRGTKP